MRGLETITQRCNSTCLKKNVRPGTIGGSGDGLLAAEKCIDPAIFIRLLGDLRDLFIGLANGAQDVLRVDRQAGLARVTPLQKTVSELAQIPTVGVSMTPEDFFEDLNLGFR